MAAVGVAVAVFAALGVVRADGPVLKLRATPARGGAGAANITLDVFRWSTDVERPPLLTALAAPVPPTAAAPAAAPAGRGAGRGGRGGRGGREAAPPASPLARLTAALRAAPTIGYIWGDGPTGYAFRYAWHSTDADGDERIVLATDRLLGAHMLPAPEAPATPSDTEFTVVELRLDRNGRGEGKTSLALPVVVDKAAATLALDAYASAPVQLRITR